MRLATAHLTPPDRHMYDRAASDHRSVDEQGTHDASLALPAVKNAIAIGRPLIAGFGDRIVTEPVGGYGLAGRS